MQRDKFNIAYISRASSSHPSEGLNVLLSDLIKPLALQGVDVVVHTTDRHENSLRNALSSNGVDERHVKVASHRVGSIVLDFLWGKRTKGGEPGRFARLKTLIGRGVVLLSRRLVGLGAWFFDVTFSNFFFKAPVLLAALLLFLSMGVLAAPFVIVLSVVLGVILIFWRAVLRAIRSLRGKQFRGRAIIKRAIGKVRRARWRVVNDLYVREQYRLAAAMNRQKAMPFVFVPWSFDGALVSKIKHKKIVVFPDAVTTLFPLRFPGEGLELTLSGIKQSLRSADGIVCYSNFVRDVQLNRFSSVIKSGARVKVIPQGYFPLPDSPTSKSVAFEGLNREKRRARNLFPQLMSQPLVPDFSEFKYIIYPTIDRPHKNTLVLAKALHVLVRERYENVKLLLTSPGLTSDVYSYVLEKRLHRDIIVMPSVPVEVLDLLCAGAAVMVHPSLAEGGDIFNFSRAVSQGTAALMSDIPVVREMFERAGVPQSTYLPWLFEATDEISLANKIQVLLHRPEEVQTEQSRTLARLGKYDFQAMAKCYHEFCKEIAYGH